MGRINLPSGGGGNPLISKKKHLVNNNLYGILFDVPHGDTYIGQSEAGDSLIFLKHEANIYEDDSFHTIKIVNLQGIVVREFTLKLRTYEYIHYATIYHGEFVCTESGNELMRFTLTGERISRKELHINGKKVGSNHQRNAIFKNGFLYTFNIIYDFEPKLYFSKFDIKGKGSAISYMSLGKTGHNPSNTFIIDKDKEIAWLQIDRGMEFVNLRNHQYITLPFPENYGTVPLIENGKIVYLDYFYHYKYIHNRLPKTLYCDGKLYINMLFIEESKGLSFLLIVDVDDLSRFTMIPYDSYTRTTATVNSIFDILNFEGKKIVLYKDEPETTIRFISV